MPIYKSTQVTGTCTNLQNNTYHNEKSWATKIFNGIKRGLSPLISRGIQTAVFWALTLFTFAVWHISLVEHAASTFREEGNGPKMMLKWRENVASQNQVKEREDKAPSRPHSNYFGINSDPTPSILKMYSGCSSEMWQPIKPVSQPLELQAKRFSSKTENWQPSQWLKLSINRNMNWKWQGTLESTANEQFSSCNPAQL